MQFEAKTVEEAIALGLSEMGISEKDAEIEVLETPTKGLFGKMKGKAVVEIIKKEKGGMEKVLEFVQGILDKMDLTAKAVIVEDAENPTINIIAEKSSEIIGFRGETLDAIQTLAGAALNIGKDSYKKVVVDCENYREKRNDTLISLAHKLEAKATDMRREVILEPMSPFERRIIHTALAESETVTTKSEGKEPNRYVVIVPNDKDEYSKPYNAARNNDKGVKGGRRDDRRSNDRRRGGKSFSKKAPVEGEKRKSSSFFGTFLGNSLKD